MCQICELPDIQRFTLAGNATLTLKSEKSGEHYTYHITATENDPEKFFVSLLTGADQQFTYLGFMELKDARTPTPQGHLIPTFRLTKKSKLGFDTTPVKAWMWFLRRCFERGELPDLLKVYHEGKCGRCGRPLTVPASIERGIGPDCWKQMGLGKLTSTRVPLEARQNAKPAVARNM